MYKSGQRQGDTQNGLVTPRALQDPALVHLITNGAFHRADQVFQLRLELAVAPPSSKPFIHECMCGCVPHVLPEPTLCAGHCSSCQGYTKEWKKKFLPPGHLYFIAVEKNKVGKKGYKEGQRWRVVREDLTEEVASEQGLKGSGGESPAGMGESTTGRGNGKGRDWGWETRGVQPVERKRGSGCSERGQRKDGGGGDLPSPACGPLSEL